MKESNDVVMYKSSGKFTNGFTEAAANSKSVIKPRTPKFFNFALHVSKKRPKSIQKMNELEYSQRQGPNNIFY